MRESRTYGSVRGARGNSRSYREPQVTAVQNVANGTKRTLQPHTPTSAFGGSADIDKTGRQVAF